MPRSSSVIRIRHGAPWVICSPVTKPSLSQRSSVEAAMAWSADGRWLATASGDRTTRIWDADNGTQLTVLRGHDDWIPAVAWLPDWWRLATASRDRTA
jgi:WD40 repeat protein